LTKLGIKGTFSVASPTRVEDINPDAFQAFHFFFAGAAWLFRGFRQLHGKEQEIAQGMSWL